MKYVYLFNVEDTNIYKIGNSKHPNQRVLEIQTSNPKKVSIVHIFESEYPTKVETVLHRKFKYKKYHEEDGDLQGEWFFLEKEDVDSFLKNCQFAENNFLLLESNTYLQDKKKTQFN